MPYKNPNILYVLVALNDQPKIDKIETHWSEFSSTFLFYDSSRKDLTKKIEDFYLSGQSQNNGAQSNASLPLNPSRNTTRTQRSVTTPNSSPPAQSINFGQQFTAFTNLFTDRFFGSPFFEAVQIQSKLSPVYAYYNDYKGQYTMLDVLTGKAKEPTPAYKKIKTWFKTKILGKEVEVPTHLGKNYIIALIMYKCAI